MLSADIVQAVLCFGLVDRAFLPVPLSNHPGTVYILPAGMGVEPAFLGKKLAILRIADDADLLDDIQPFLCPPARQVLVADRDHAPEHGAAAAALDTLPFRPIRKHHTHQNILLFLHCL